MASILDEAAGVITDETGDPVFDETGGQSGREYQLQPAPHTGLPAVMITPADGDTAIPVPRCALLIAAGSEPVTATLPEPLYDTLTAGPRTVEVPAGTWWLVPLPPNVYGYGPVTIGWAGDTTEALVAYVYLAGLASAVMRNDVLLAAGIVVVLILIAADSWRRSEWDPWAEFWDDAQDRSGR